MKKQIVCSLLLLLLLNSQAQTDSIYKSSPRNSPVFTFVEAMPEYPGGEGEIMKFISANVHYPQWEMENGIQGKVLVRFVVMKDGSIDSVTVVRSVSPGIDSEAVRVISILPKFSKPGYQQGKPVMVYYTIPLTLRLQDDVKEKKKRKKDRN